MNYKWLLAIPVAVIAIVVGIVVNDNLGHSSSENISELIDIDNDDLDIDWTKYSTYDFNLSETVNIYKSGTYNITGTLNAGGININVEDGFVKLILNNVSITNPNGPAISCTAGDELVIELVGENYLKDGSSYDSKLDEDIKGTIYSKADLTFTGEGFLNVTANYQDGIVSKDDLTFRNGTYNIYAQDDGIRGKDSVRITDGDFVINAGADAIKSNNETDNAKGFVYVEKGKILISCGDDGIHAERYLIIDDGEIEIAKSYEGLEAPNITINNGAISVNSNDDGINAGSGTSESNTPRPGGMMDADESCVVTINGGSIYVNAAGDGIDSNGYVYINGGSVVVDGPTNNGNGALDAGIGFVVKGGEAIAVGSSGMADTFGVNSTIDSISYYLSSTYNAGSKIEIKDSNGDMILTHTSAKKFSHIAAVSEKFMIGETYTIYINGKSISKILLVSTVTSNRSTGGGPSMGPGKR